MWSSWNQALQAGCLVSAWAVALMMMSLKETLPAWSPNWLFRASRASLARSMSTSVVRKKWGMGPSDVANRLAIVFRIWVRGTSWYRSPLPAPRDRRRGRLGSGRRCRGDGLARCGDDRDDASDCDGLILGGGHLAQHAFGARHEIHYRLISLDLGQRLTGFHGVAVPLEPLHHAPLLHGGGERFHVDVGGHGWGDQSR